MAEAAEQALQSRAFQQLVLHFHGLPSPQRDRAVKLVDLLKVASALSSAVDRAELALALSLELVE
jgi:hypothetical protein